MGRPQRIMAYAAMVLALVSSSHEQTSAVPISTAEVVSFESYKSRLVTLARAAGVRATTIQAIVPFLRLNERAIQLDRAQKPPIIAASGSPPNLLPYLREHVTASIISRGRARYYTQWPNLLRVYNQSGVDPATVIAIYGKETSYGTVTGSFDLVDALASLAFEGRRREMFEAEFIATLKLLDRGITRDRLKGSYAGATGYPQFMPSVYLRLAADGDSDGTADIWSNEADAFASIANYLKDAGWRAGTPWGTQVTVPAGFERARIRRTEPSPTCPAVYRRHSKWLPVSEWRSLGIRITGKPLPDRELAALMESADGSAYLLTTNYMAILKYNCSNFYGMSVALLSDQIARR